MSSPLDPFSDDSADDGLLASCPTASAPSRWSFLDAPSPDLSLVLTEPDSPRQQADALSLHSLDYLGDAASDDGRSTSARSLDDEGAVLHAARLTRVQSVGLLVPSPGSDALRASTSTAPDSLVDPDMSHLGGASTPARPASASGLGASSSSCVVWPASDGPASRADLAGLGLPTPASSSSSAGDPFERAFGRSAGAVSARERLSVLGQASLQRREDDTSSSFDSGGRSSMAYLDTTMPFEAAARSRPSSMLSASSSAAHRDVARPRPASRSSRASFPAPPGRPLSQHVVVDFPAVPPRSYSPDVPRSRSTDELAARAPRPPPDPSPPRSTLALRRSAQHLPPLLPSSAAPSSSRHLSIPSPAGFSPSSPASPASPSQIPLITRSDDGFYRLPVTPSSASHSVGRTRRERQSTSDLAFPLPPLPDSATHLVFVEGPSGGTDSPGWRSSAYHRSSPSAATRTGGAPTPSPTAHSLPSSPPPTSPPPPLPDFVSLFLDSPPRRTSSDSASSSSSSSSNEHARTRYPPAPPAAAPPRHSHARAQDSLSGAVAGPALRHSLRQRAVGAPIVGEACGAEGGGAGGGARDRLDAWLRGVAPARPPSSSLEEKVHTGASSGVGAGSSRVRWAERAAPGWSLRSDPARWGGERAQGASSSSRVRSAWRSRRVRIGAALAVAVVLLLVVGLAVGLSRRAPIVAAPAACNCEHGGSVRVTSGGGCECVCSAGWGGTSCHLNATCVGGGGGALVAQGVLDVAEKASAMWEPKIDTAQLGALLQTYFVPPSTSSSSSCQAQLALLALPNLPSSTFPSRLAWAESALVHTLALTESNSTLSRLRTIASALSFAPFGDAPASKPNSNYQVIAGGWTWDFSVLQRSATGSWASVVKPSSDSTVRLAAAPAALAALDRLAPVAAAASAQRTKALEHYWATALGRSGDELQAFREAVRRAEVVVPLDATANVGGGQGMMDLAQHAQSGAASFPQAVGCWGGLSETAAERVRALEVDVFGLSAVSSSQALDSSCLDRPLYGILNLLNLRLPFPSSDKRSSLPQQSLVLKASAIADGVTVHAGELLAAGPLAAARTSPSLPATPERFGLLSRLDHVLLDLLSALPTATADNLIDYVLSSPSTPPSPSTYPSLLDNSLPLIEIQLWGGLQYDDIHFARSSLVAATSPSSSSSAPALFFGSSTGDAWRSWALSNTQHASLPRVEWVVAAESEQVVVDQGRGGTAFEGVWAQAASGSLKTSGAVCAALQKAGLVGG
ncbi:hypothetical protein JCM9279_005012 [Rhodotorula babjevae]